VSVAPHPSAFKSVFGHRPPAKHSRTAADLQRHVDGLSAEGSARVAAFLRPDTPWPLGVARHRDRAGG
jgi:hypothetical protein